MILAGILGLTPSFFYLLFFCIYILTSCENLRSIYKALNSLRSYGAFVCKICCVGFDLSMY